MELILSQPLNLVLRDSCPPWHHSFERINDQSRTAAQTAIPPTPAGAQRHKPHHEVMVRINTRLETGFCFSHTEQTEFAEPEALLPGSSATLDWTSFSPQPSSAISQPLQFAQKEHKHLHGDSEPAKKVKKPSDPLLMQVQSGQGKNLTEAETGQTERKGGIFHCNSRPNSTHESKLMYI